MHGCTHAAIEIARKLGVQYLWIDSLCIVHDDQDDLMKALSTMSNIYSSAILTICVDEDEDGTAQCLVNRPVLLRPFSIFLNWSQPANALVILSCKCERFSSYKTHRRAEMRPETAATFQVNERSDPEHCHRHAQPEAELDDAQRNEASLKVDNGIQFVENRKNFEALASFMAAREIVSTFKSLTGTSWKTYALISANIASVYLLEDLPAIASSIAEAALVLRNDLPEPGCSIAIELDRLHFVMGSIYNALDKPRESVTYYEEANKEFQKEPEEQPDIADWKSVLNLKLAEHLTRAKDYKGAHALLQQSLGHFQLRETVAAQAHLARTLHRKSVTFEAEGSKIMGNAIQAAARHTWIAVREARGCAVPEGSSPLTGKDFDGEVEFWYRYCRELLPLHQ
ncbi:hypothetical protein MMC28_003571 [Mycoblastus sanguinarius]|nr:hypothetical protein [Mycoblastus sanguinarius]